MPVEIERKFLVDPSKLPGLPGGRHIHQLYLSLEPVVRIRTSEWRAWITVKGEGTISRDEFEYPIPHEDALAMRPLAKCSLKKVRYVLQDKNDLWEVDQFKDTLSGLWLAEIELGHAEQVFGRPPWLDQEVTEDPRYTNVRLARDGLPV